MNDILKKIIDADKKARESVKQAIDSKNNIKQICNNKKSEIHNKYMLLANNQIEKAYEDDKEQAKSEFKKKESMLEKNLNKLDTLYEQNAEKWIEDICHTVIDNLANG